MTMWKQLVSKDGSVTLPWTGGDRLHSKTRVFKLETRPPELGWFRFIVHGRLATKPTAAEPVPSSLTAGAVGYLVGDRLVPDGGQYVDPDPSQIIRHSVKVYLLPEQLERFARVRTGKIYPEGPLLFLEPAFPLGPEDAVLTAYLDRKPRVSNLPGVTPALDAAFRMATFQRLQAEQRRTELARLRAEEARRLEVTARLGDGAGRRIVAKQNFAEAAQAALAVGGAEYLDHRRARDEWVVTYRVDGQRLECVCDDMLRIIDAGVCLTDHRSGERGDTYFTLESLPAVIRQAVAQRKLVIWRHV